MSARSTRFSLIVSLLAGMGAHRVALRFRAVPRIDTRENVDKMGGEAVSLSPGLELGLSERLKLAALFKFPV